MLKSLIRKYDIKADIRDYQDRIVTQTVSNLMSGHSTMIESPTGSGKTFMGLSACKLLLDKTPGLKVGWCTMRRNNLEQVEEENFKRGFNIDLHLISMFDRNPPKVDVLMVDEGHHDATTSMNIIHSKCSPKYLMAATATPIRSDRAALFFSKVVRDANIRFLIKSGYLSQFDHFTLPNWEPNTVARAFNSDPRRWGKSVMFFHTKKDCDIAQEALRAQGIASTVVTGETDRESQITDFRSGKLQVLINMMVLTEGFDCPEIQTAWVRPSSKGPTIQMAGRVLRKFEDRIKNIIQSTDTRYEFTKEASPNAKFITDHSGWTEVIENQKLEEATQKVLKELSLLAINSFNKESSND